MLVEAAGASFAAIGAAACLLAGGGAWSGGAWSGDRHGAQGRGVMDVVI